MRAAKRFEEFRTVQRESMQVAAVLRKALFSRPLESPSPDQGGSSKSPSPSGGIIRLPSRNRTIAYALIVSRIGAT
jgi:hypothetical protein